MRKIMARLALGLVGAVVLQAAMYIPCEGCPFMGGGGRSFGGMGRGMTLGSGGGGGGGGGGMSAGEAKILELTSIKWEDKAPSIGGGTAANRLSADAIASLPGVSDAKTKKMPALVYFTSGSAQNGKSVSSSSPQGKACRNLEDDLFDGSSRTVGLLARHFSRAKVDVKSITSQQDPVFNAQNAPLVLVTAADGSRVALLSGRIAESDLVSAMSTALQKSGINAQSIALQSDQILARIRQIEDEKQKLTQRMSACTAKAKSAQSKGDVAKAGACKQEETQYKSEIEKLEKGLSDAYGLLNKLGKPT
jgi:hypothetical protein